MELKQTGKTFEVELQAKVFQEHYLNYNFPFPYMEFETLVQTYWPTHRQDCVHLLHKYEIRNFHN